MKTVNEIEKYGKMFDTQASVVDDVVRWNSNNQVPPTDILQYFLQAGKSFDLEKSLRVRDMETQEFLKNYRESMKNYTPSAEELFEMRSAFGKDTVVVNIVTGQKIQL